MRLEVPLPAQPPFSHLTAGLNHHLVAEPVEANDKYILEKFREFVNCGNTCTSRGSGVKKIGGVSQAPNL